VPDTLYDMKPLLFLDVDGVLNCRVMPFHEYLVTANASEVAKNGFTKQPSGDTIDYTVRFNAHYPDWLEELGGAYQLVWATTWEKLANKLLGPLLGLPELEVVEFSAYPRDMYMEAMGLVAEWKWDCLVKYAVDRPFVFVDDQAERVAREYPLKPGVPQSALFVEYGLTRDNVDQLLAHAATLAAE
jgi:hypothetical protein